MEYDLLVTVAEDLEYLARWGSEISNAEIRRGSAILRRLLVDDVYGLAWRAIGETKEPLLIAIDLSLMLGDQANRVLYALAGGALLRGARWGSMCANEGSTSIIRGEPSQGLRENGYPFEKVFTLSKYLSSLSGVVEGRTFNRRDVIKYIANVKGGVHLSVKMRKAEEKLIARLSKIEKKIMLHKTDENDKTNGLLIEILAIGQALGNSSDARAFIQKVRVLPH